MKPQDDYRNGDDSGEDSAGEEAATLERELSLMDAGAPARSLAALNALRKARQHYDTVLVARGAEVPAHRAVLAAASPLLLHALGEGAYRLDGVEPDALRALVEYAYTGELHVRDAPAALRLYRAAWRLRLEPARAHLAERLLRRLQPATALELRALPGLEPAQLSALDAYVAEHFAAICASGALAALPQLRLDVMRESSALAGAELPRALADAALAWLRARAEPAATPDDDLEEVCARTHLLYVDAAGALRDCGELPAAQGHAAHLRQYRREAHERARAPRRPPSPSPPAASALPALRLGERAPSAACAVLAAGPLEGARGASALLELRGRLLGLRVTWREGAGVARGGPLGGAEAEGAGGERRARLAAGRAALGAAALGARLLVCGGYDRARVLQAAELYEPVTNAWTDAPAMRGPRARFPLVRLRGALYAVGGSDGLADLDTVDAWRGSEWQREARLPLALSQCAAAAHEARGELFAVGGWAQGRALKRVLRYDCEARAWGDAPPLSAPRSQCAAALWRGALWALGGCDEWRCLPSTEALRLEDPGPGAAAWAPGPALPTPRRSAGAAEWRGMLVLAGGSDGAASLRRTDWLADEGAAWRAGPPLRRARAGLGLAVLDDTLYAVGGFDGKEFLACVECLYEPTGEWTTLCTAPAPSPPLAATAAPEEVAAEQ